MNVDIAVKKVSGFLKLKSKSAGYFLNRKEGLGLKEALVGPLKIIFQETFNRKNADIQIDPKKSQRCSEKTFLKKS